MKARFLRIFTLAAGMVLLLAVVVGCAGAKPLETPADFTGQITEVYPGDPGRFLAEFDNGEWVDKYVVTITEATNIFRQDGESYTEAAFDSLEAGQTVAIWFSGPVKESYPMQVDAGQIVILPAP